MNLNRLLHPLLDFFARSPFVLLSLCLGSGVVIASRVVWPFEGWVIMAITGGVAAIVFSKEEIISSLLILTATLALGGALWSQVESKPVHHIERLLNNCSLTLDLEGEIDSEVRCFQGRFGKEEQSFILRVTKAARAGEKLVFSTGRLKIYVYGSLLRLSYGQAIHFQARLRPLKRVTNPGEADMVYYFKAQGVSGFGWVKEEKVRVISEGKGHWVQRWAIQSKKILERQIYRVFAGKDASFVDAILLGERGPLTDEVKRLFNHTGTTHLLAVSGLNVGLIAVVVLFILRGLGISQRISLLVVLPLLIIYTLITGANPPVVRATLMAMIFLVARLCDRESNLLSSLGLSAFLILLFNPYDLFSIDFQLSFAAVAVIILFVPFLTRDPVAPFSFEKRSLGERMKEWGRGLFWTTFAVNCMILPLLAFSFHFFSLVGWVVNLVAVPLFFLIFCSCLVSLIIPAISFLSVFLIYCFFNVLTVCGSMPFVVMSVSMEKGVWFLIALPFIVWILKTSRVNRHWIRGVMTVFVLLNLFIWSDVVDASRPKLLRVTMLDVGQGDALVFQFPEGGVLVADGGPSQAGWKVLVPYLRSRGINRIDAVVVSHPQEDHIGGLVGLLDELNVKLLLDSGADYPTTTARVLKEKAAQYRIRHEILRKGDQILGFKGIKIKALGPVKNSANPKTINEDSVVLKIQYGDISFLLTGDVENSGIRQLLNQGQGIRAMVLKVPHHGSKSGAGHEAFVEQVSPKISLISVGADNRYGLPASETLELLNRTHSAIYRTDKQGAILIETDGQRMFVRTFQDVGKKGDWL